MSAALTEFLAPVVARWRAFTPRDRQLLSVAAAVLGLFVIWTFAVQPAWRTLSRAPVELDALDTQCLMTGTDPVLFEALGSRAQRVTVRDGRLEKDR